MKIAILLPLLIIEILSRSYPLYKQCNPAWKSQQLGTSSKTICSSGSLITCAAMGLSGTGPATDPSVLNKWLKAHSGYINGDTFVWGSIAELGLIYEGKFNKNRIREKIEDGKVVICNVRSGTHWVLAHQYAGDSILVNDPAFTNTSYPFSQIVQGQTAVYRVANMTETMQKPILRQYTQ